VDDILGVFVLVTLLVFKVILMRSVWRMAKEQGRSQWLFLTASAFAALVVFLGLWSRDRERKSWAQLEADKIHANEASKSALE
jgi:hypothetical protein